jgi:hypothetical protein
MRKSTPENKLTLKQKRFCELFATDREFFGNGTQSYVEAYNVDLTKPNAYITARSGAKENLTKPHLLKYINMLLDEMGLSQTHVDKQLLFLITQNADFSAKLGAIREYNNLKGRIIKRMDHTTGGESFNVEVKFIGDGNEAY